MTAFESLSDIGTNTALTGSYIADRILESRTNEDGDTEYKVCYNMFMWMEEDLVKSKHSDIYKQFEELRKKIREEENKPPPKKRGRKRKFHSLELIDASQPPPDIDKKLGDTEKKPWRSKRLKENNDKHKTTNFFCKYCEKVFYTDFIFQEHIQDHIEEGIDVENDFKNVDLTKTFTTIIKAKRVEYKCSRCEQIFREKRDAKTHLLVHDGTNPWQCKKCGKHFLRKHKFDRHMLTHIDTNEFKCKKCDRKFKEHEYLRRHALFCGVTSLTCPTCDQLFTEKRHLLAHLAIHKGSNENYCATCDKEFLRKSAYENHMNFHSKSKPHVCPTCSKDYISKTELHNHMRTHTEDIFRCDNCSEVFALAEDLEMHYQMSEICLDIGCAECNMQFVTVDDLALHLHTFTQGGGNKPVVCPYCQRGFHAANMLKKHHQMCHIAEKPKLCSQCDEIFGTERLLAKHIIDSHEKPVTESTLFPCVDCSMSFADAMSLKTHIINQHQSEDTFRCIPCVRTFNSSFDLSKHMATKQHLKSIEVKKPQHGCNICSKKFYTVAELKAHRLIHLKVDNIRVQHQQSVIGSETPIFLNDGLVSIDIGDGRQVVLSEEQASMMNSRINIDGQGNISFICIPEQEQGKDVIKMISEIDNSTMQAFTKEAFEQQAEQNTNAHLQYVIYDENSAPYQDNDATVNASNTPLNVENHQNISVANSSFDINEARANEEISVVTSEAVNTQQENTTNVDQIINETNLNYANNVDAINEQTFYALSQLVQQGQVDISSLETLETPSAT